MRFIQRFISEHQYFALSAILGSLSLHDASPIYSFNKSTEAFYEAISEFAFTPYLVTLRPKFEFQKGWPQKC
jgi:hypothetical protein